MSVASSTRRVRPARAADIGSRSRSVARAQLEAVRDRQGEHVAVVQRARLLAGAVRAVDKYGYAHATVSEITALAHVSRRTFYELFAGSEECLLAMFEEVLGRVSAQVAAAELDPPSRGAGGLAWRERVRGGLWAILCFLDAEPVLARVAVVESAKGGPQIAELRERLFAQLADILDEGRSAGGRVADCPQLTAEGLVGAVLSILHTRLVRGTLKGTPSLAQAGGGQAPHGGGQASEQQPLTSLQGELMAMILAPYLGAAAARAERNRRAPAPLPAPVSSLKANGAVRGGTAVGVEPDPLHGISMRFTYRTACVLEAVATEPGMSNRGVGNAAGIPDQGQLSKLLARLQGLGLVENTAPNRRGAANAWSLTPAGERVARVVVMDAAVGTAAQ